MFRLAAGALVVATVITRLPFMTQTLYGFDSANYALGVRDFYNVAFHQPHPPGYPRRPGVPARRPLGQGSGCD